MKKLCFTFDNIIRYYTITMKNESCKSLKSIELTEKINK